MRTNKKKKKELSFHEQIRFYEKYWDRPSARNSWPSVIRNKCFESEKSAVAKFIIVLSIIVNYPRWFLDVSVSYRSECVSRTDKHSVQRMYLRSDVLSSFFCGLLIIPPVSESCRKQICSYACSDGSCPISDLFV